MTQPKVYKEVSGTGHPASRRLSCGAGAAGDAEQQARREGFQSHVGSF